MMTDPISDLLVRIQNGGKRGYETVKVPVSKLKGKLLGILKAEGFIVDFGEEPGAVHPTFLVRLRFLEEGQPIVTGMRRISKPGLRVYVGKQEVDRVQGGLGIAILSTSKGIMTDHECRAAGIGGEVLCQVW